MDTVSNVIEQIEKMNEEDQNKCYQVFREIQHQRQKEGEGKDLRKRIILNTVKLKAKVAEIPTNDFTDDVDGFQKKMRDLENGIMGTVRLVGQFIEYQAAQKAREYAQDLVTKGVDFCEIVVQGHRVVITDEGRALLQGEGILVDDDIPF